MPAQLTTLDVRTKDGGRGTIKTSLTAGRAGTAACPTTMDDAAVPFPAGDQGMATTAGTMQERRPLLVQRLIPGGNRTVLLVLPAAALFVIFFVIPVLLLLAVAFNPPKSGVVDFDRHQLTLEGFRRFFDRPLYYEALIRSVTLAVATAFLALLLGYPLAYFVGKERRPGRANLYMILILSSMQLDLIIRVYGMMVLLGDTGLINDSLIRWGVLDAEHPLPLMFNRTGVIIGLVQLTLPFMILSLIGIIQGVDASVEEAARSLGAGRWRTFFTITFPLTMPGVLAGSLLVFAIAIGSFAVPVLMGGSRVIVTPMQIAEQIQNSANWRYGSAIATLLLGVSLAAVFIYHRYTQKTIGGLV